MDVVVADDGDERTARLVAVTLPRDHLTRRTGDEIQLGRTSVSRRCTTHQLQYEACAEWPGPPSRPSRFMPDPGRGRGLQREGAVTTRVPRRTAPTLGPRRLVVLVCRIRLRVRSQSRTKRWRD